MSRRLQCFDLCIIARFKLFKFLINLSWWSISTKNYILQFCNLLSDTLWVESFTQLKIDLFQVFRDFWVLLLSFILGNASYCWFWNRFFNFMQLFRLESDKLCWCIICVFQWWLVICWVLILIIDVRSLET